MPDEDDEGGAYSDFNYGANLRRGDSEAGREMGKRSGGGRPASTRKAVHDIVREAAEDGADVSSTDVARELMNRGGLFRSKDLRKVRGQVNKILNHMEYTGDVERHELNLHERHQRGYPDSGPAIAWRATGVQPHTPQTHGSAPEKDPAANAPDNWGPPDEKPVRGYSRAKPDREPDWFDKQAAKRKDREAEQSAKAPDNWQKGRRGGGGGKPRGRHDPLGDLLGTNEPKGKGKPDKGHDPLGDFLGTNKPAPKDTPKGGGGDNKSGGKGSWQDYV